MTFAVLAPRCRSVAKGLPGGCFSFPQEREDSEQNTEGDNTALIEPGHAYHCHPEKVKHALGL